jgi:hypothetical protein
MEDKINTNQDMYQCPYLTIRGFAKNYSEWTESSIRWLIYNNTAGFNDTVVRRVGKSKILISVIDFWKWIEMQNQNKSGLITQQSQAVYSNVHKASVK